MSSNWHLNYSGGDTLEAKEGAQCVGKILDILGPCQIFQTDNGGEFGKECAILSGNMLLGLERFMPEEKTRMPILRVSTGH